MVDATQGPHGDPERGYTIPEIHRHAPDCRDCGRRMTPRGLPPGEPGADQALRFRWREIRFHCAACEPLTRP